MEILEIIIEDYQRLAIETAVYPRKSGVEYLTLGLAGEIGEIANLIKKTYRDHGGAYTAKKSEMVSEVGDACWYCAALATELGFTLRTTHTLLPKFLPDLMNCGLKLAELAGVLARYAHADAGYPLYKLTQVLSYLNAVAYHLGIDFGSILDANLNKLAARKANNTSRKYRLQNRYQDSGWEWMTEEFQTVEEAIAFARQCSCKPIIYGMVRVVGPFGHLWAEYGAGEGLDKGWETCTAIDAKAQVS